MDVQELIDRMPTRKTGLVRLNLRPCPIEIFRRGGGGYLLKSKLRQDGIRLLKYVQQEDTNFSIQRDCLIRMLETNQ